MEAIQHHCGVGTMGLDGPHIGVATGPFGLSFLLGTEHVREKSIDGFLAFATANPHHTGAVQVIDQRGVFVALG